MSHFQPTKLSIVIISLIILILISLLRKNILASLFGYVRKWSQSDIILCILFVVFCSAIVGFSIRILKNEYEQKVKLSYKFAKSDIQWTNQTVMKMSAIAISGGVLSSFIGIGGGIIYNPVIIGFGVHPSVSGATGMYMVMLGTFSTTFQYFILGVIPYDYSIAFGVCIIFSTVVGIYTINIPISSIKNNE